MKKIEWTLPAITRDRTAAVMAVCYPIVLEILLYCNVVWYVQIFNILLMGLFYGLFFLLMRRIRPSMIAITVLMLALSIANEFSINVRSLAFQIGDFMCLFDAMRLSSRYSFEFTPIMIKDIICSVLALTAGLVLMRRYDDKPHRRRMALGGSAVLCFSAVIAAFSGMENYNDGDIKFNINEFTRENGVLYSLFVELKQHDVNEPTGYSAENAKEALACSGGVIEESRPNLIVIMNESLADYDLVGSLPLTQDVLPYIHSLEGNCIKGRALTSVYGGYTCNSEWEFLTGSSMAFLPVTAIPYNQFIEQETDSLAASLKTLGYDTCAVHPYHGIEWNRETNYPLMGFDRFVTGESFGEVTEEMLETLPEGTEESLYFGDLDYIRGFVSDEENYRMVKKIMEEKTPGQPQFIFNVTIQNHGSYEYEGEDFESTEFCEGAKEEVNQYLTVANRSDAAFAELLAWFETYPEDTIILMFGDHQPAVEMPYTALYADAENAVAVRETNYTVPYVMWANYDVDWAAQETTSLNYLSALLKQNAGLPLDNWDTFRLETMQQYPALNAYGALDANGQFVPLENAMQADSMKEYNRLQYYRIFDEGDPEETTESTP